MIRQGRRILLEHHRRLGLMPTVGVTQRVFQEAVCHDRHGLLLSPGFVIEHRDKEPINGGRVIFWTWHGNEGTAI